MPKAAMHKHHGTMARQDNVWLAWQAGVVYPVTKALRE